MSSILLITLILSTLVGDLSSTIIDDCSDKEEFNRGACFYVDFDHPCCQKWIEETRRFEDYSNERSDDSNFDGNIDDIESLKTTLTISKATSSLSTITRTTGSSVTPTSPTVNSVTQTLYKSNERPDYQETSITTPSSLLNQSTTMNPVSATNDRMFLGGHRRSETRNNSQVALVNYKSALKKNANRRFQYTRRRCEQLKVPCRFVTDHICCSFPVPLPLAARPRAMDGSADLVNRRRNHRLGSESGRSLTSSSSSSSFNTLTNNENGPKYSSSVKKENVQLYRMQEYALAPTRAALATMLAQCWRMLDVSCEFEHPCCQMRSRPNGSKGEPGQTRLTRWLNSRYTLKIPNQYFDN